MTPNRALLSSLTALALLLSCSASGAREGAAPPDKADSASAAAAGAKVQYRDGLNGVDFTGMDAASKERAIKLMNDQVCDCGCQYGSIASCRVNDPSCTKSLGYAKTILDAVKTGKTDAQIVAAVKASGAPSPAAPAQPAPPTGPVEISMENVQMKGNPKAIATIVEYADYQCPYCARALPVVEQLLTKYGDDVRYVFKQFPLTSIHPFAEPAARASLAAARQGKFWQMHDTLFQNMRALDDASLRKYAQDLGLDMARFDQDRVDPALVQMLNEEIAEANRVGVQGTPAFFVNGVQAPSWDVETMSRMIDAAKSGGDVAAVVAEVRNRYAEQARKQAEIMQQAATRVHDIDIAGSPILGNPKAPVTIVEFSDFQCPYCASSVPLLKQILAAYPDKVRLVYKQMPLNMHPNAKPAAIASLEAMEHGKFWEMHDLLFQNYAQLNRDNILNMAKQVGVNPAEVQKALDSQEHSKVIDKDIADYMKTGLPMSTPSFFVNGRKVMQRDLETFKRMIDEALSGSNPPATS